ncbi:MAG: hypothetical protein ACI8P2_003198, partial [Candidatus Latescibacterota bacterium]
CLLRENSDKLHVLAQALLDYEVLDDVELDLVLTGEELARDSVRRESEQDSNTQGTDDSAGDVEQGT